jgi:phosphatidylglycerol lysyltransferase
MDRSRQEHRGGRPATITGLEPTVTARRVPAWTTLLGIALFGLAIFWLHHLLAQYRWQDILAQIHAIPASKVLRAALLTCTGYACLTMYDALGVRFAGARVAYPRVALISFMAYAIGHNVGLNTLSGGAIRYRAYSTLGLSATQIGTIIAFGTLTFTLGAAALLGLSLLTQPGLSGSVLHVHAWLANLVGCLLLAVVASYLAVAWVRREPLCFRSFRIPVLRPRVALAQISVACADLLFAAGVLYVLLPPQAAIGFAAFAGVYLIAIAAGIISNVPGGIGVFETVLLLLLRAVPPDRLLGALLVYRALYYFGPFGLALVLLGLHELWAHRAPVVRLACRGRTWFSSVASQTCAIAVFGAGAVLLFSLAASRRAVPLRLLELGHWLGIAVGVGLLIIANGLSRGLDAAWRAALWSLCAGVLLVLLNGVDFEAAALLAAVAVLLALSGARFQRRASLSELQFSGPWIVAMILTLGAAAWLALCA